MSKAKKVLDKISVLLYCDLSQEIKLEQIGVEIDIFQETLVKEKNEVLLKAKQSGYYPKISEEDVNLVISLAYQGYKLDYDYVKGFSVSQFGKTIHTPNKFAKDFDSELHARVTIMKEAIRKQLGKESE